ncbi:MAG: hypothetical protein HYR60_07035 [Acidobacteria bacterium]|nr:hypothetical protein [Acidobacteriota bacterium]MBI3471237.1 hypothetical protein [Candidatus Solibacter usitatus]
MIPMQILALVCFAGCTRRVPRNSNCEWPAEGAMPLDMGKTEKLQHLSDDALIAEDLAIRHADTSRGTRSGRFAGFGEYARTRERCMAALFEVIGNNHGVTPQQVRQSLAHRRTSLDLAVILSFAVLYGFAASVVARRVRCRFPLDEGWLAGVVATVMTSAVVSTAGVLLGEMWSLAAETVRIGNDHLSYRVDRIPWNQHRLDFFAGGVVLFWLIAGLHYRASVPVARREAGTLQ